MKCVNTVSYVYAYNASDLYDTALNLSGTIYHFITIFPYLRYMAEPATLMFANSPRRPLPSFITVRICATGGSGDGTHSRTSLTAPTQYIISCTFRPSLGTQLAKVEVTHPHHLQTDIHYMCPTVHGTWVSPSIGSMTRYTPGDMLSLRRNGLSLMHVSGQEWEIINGSTRRRASLRTNGGRHASA